MDNPWLSILIPVFNVEKYVVECLESIRKQWIPGVEVIILNDAATDDSLLRIENFRLRTAFPIKFIEHPHNRGLSAARNSLKSAANGDYLWFIDSDDAIETNAIQTLKQIIDSETPDLVLCDYRIIHENKYITKRLLKKERHVSSFAGKQNRLLPIDWNFFQGLYTAGKFHIWSKIFKRSLWSVDFLFPEGRHFEDLFATPRITLKATNYYYCKQVWIKYRRHEQSILATPSPDKIEQMITALAGSLPLWTEKFGTTTEAANLAYCRFCLKMYRFAKKDLQRSKSPNTIKRQTRRSLKKLFLNSIDVSQWHLVTTFCKHFEFKRFIRSIVI